MIQVGQVFSSLTVLSKGEPYVLPTNGKKRARWNVRCACGATKLVHASNLSAGLSKSCGCVGLKLRTEASRTHGMSKTKVYKVWCSMIQRTTNPNYPKWCDYGGRGIKVCDEWRSFEQFYVDMGDPPEGMTLEREKNDEDYSAANCKWATVSQQGNNRRSTVILEYQGKAQSITLWALELGIAPHTLANRIRLGWSVERALTASVRPY